MIETILKILSILSILSNLPQQRRYLRVFRSFSSLQRSALIISMFASLTARINGVPSSVLTFTCAPFDRSKRDELALKSLVGLFLFVNA
jgi:hypothetical protein